MTTLAVPHSARFAIAGWWKTFIASPIHTPTERAFADGEEAGFDGLGVEACPPGSEELRQAWLTGHTSGRLAVVHW